MDESFSKENFILLFVKCKGYQQVGSTWISIQGSRCPGSAREQVYLQVICALSLCVFPVWYIWSLTFVPLSCEHWDWVGQCLWGKGTAVPLPRYSPSPRSQLTVPPRIFRTLIKDFYFILSNYLDNQEGLVWVLLSVITRIKVKIILCEILNKK